MIVSLAKSMRTRPGYISSFGFFTSTMIYTFYQAPKIEDKYIRYACAGTAATLLVELLTHAVDTVNMRSKVINGPKLYVL
jgi:hypothetical protein